MDAHIWPNKSPLIPRPEIIYHHSYVVQFIFNPPFIQQHYPLRKSKIPPPPFWMRNCYQKIPPYKILLYRPPTSCHGPHFCTHYLRLQFPHSDPPYRQKYLHNISSSRSGSVSSIACYSTISIYIFLTKHKI